MGGEKISLSQKSDLVPRYLECPRDVMYIFFLSNFFSSSSNYVPDIKKKRFERPQRVKVISKV